MADNRRSSLITAVSACSTAPCCAPVGFGDGDFSKPIVGVANGHSTMNPAMRAFSRWWTAP